MDGFMNNVYEQNNKKLVESHLEIFKFKNKAEAIQNIF